VQRLIETSKDNEMSDNEDEQEGNPLGVNAGAAEQPLIGQPQIVQPSIRPVANFQVTRPEKFNSNLKSSRSGYKDLKGFARQPGSINKAAKTK